MFKRRKVWQTLLILALATFSVCSVYKSQVPGADLLYPSKLTLAPNSPADANAKIFEFNPRKYSFQVVFHFGKLDKVDLSKIFKMGAFPSRPKQDTYYHSTACLVPLFDFETQPKMAYIGF